MELERTDGIMVMFEHPGDAVAFALAYQRAVSTLDPPLVARVGVHTGPMVVRANPDEHVARGAKRLEVDGLALAMTARVMSLAQGGQTLLTVASVPPSLAEGVRLVTHGHWRLKGIAEPVEVLEIGAESAPFAPPPDAPKAYRVVRRQDGWVPARRVGTSLPPEVDAFVGRATELRAVAEVLDGGARVVSVLGPPGVGKTRLVTRYGWTWLGDWPGGVWFCDLGGVHDEPGFEAAVQRALGPRPGAGGARAGARVAGLGRCLLVFDRLDARAGHAGHVAALLAAAPEAQVVTTGPEPPGLRGEAVVTLAAPPLEDAVALFLRRAAAASKDFDPSPGEREVVATLVERLERLPRDVELAAAQVRTAPPHVLLARLEARSTRLLTLVSLELVGSAEARQRMGERAFADAVERHDAVVRRALVETGDGEQLENAGDALLLVFATPSSAVRFAVRARSAVREWNAGRAEPLTDRFAVHLGEVVVRSGARAQASLALDTCACLRGLSDADRILMTRPVFDNARQHLTAAGLRWWSHGDYTLAGLDAPVEVCEVSDGPDGERSAPRDTADARRVAESDQDGVAGWRPAPELAVPGAPYVLERPLGEGAVGEVWLARHATTRDPRVFKFCFGAERLRSLRREARIFGILRERVGAHPHLTFVREVRLDEPPCWLMVDHTDGVDLPTWWESRRDALPSIAERLALVAQVADGLHAAHEAGVLHRDVKPANVLVETVAGQVRARLTDFGIGEVTSSRALAGLAGTGLPGTVLGGGGSSSGTLMFLAPELVSGGPASVRSDVYALGVTLWQLLVGDLRRAPPMDWDRAVPDELLREDLRRCFAGDPAERWETAAALGRSLRRLEVRRAERRAEEALAAQDPSATADRPHYLLELQLLRVGASLRVGLSHTGPDHKGRLSPQRADVSLDPAVLATLHGDAAAYGRHLVARVLAETSLRQRFLEVERAALSAGTFLRLVVSIDPSAQELQELRWEQLCHPETGRELSASQHVLFSRHVASRDGQPVRLRGRAPLVALVAVSAPSGARFSKSGLPPIDAAAEVARLREALQGAEVRVVGGPDEPLTADRLFEALRGGVDVLCLAAHAAYRRSTGAPMLLLQDAEGDAVPVEGDALGARLAALPELPRLVLLTPPLPTGAARTSTTSRPAAHSPLAVRVCDAGVAAVVAVQGALSGTTAGTLLPVFFSELARDGQVDRALAAARWRVRAQEDAWMPALYGRVRDGRLWYTAGFRTGGDSAQIWKRLLPAVRQGKLVPILGPGLLRNLLGVPADFALELARTHRFPMAAHDWDDLARVNQFLSVRESRFNVLRSVQDQMLASLVRRHGHWLPHDEVGPGARPRLDRLLELVSAHVRETRPNDPHRILAELGASVYVTTTFDPLMERALEAAGRDPQPVLTRWRYRKAPAPGDEVPPRPSPAAPVVYHAFGAFGVDEERSLVLTEDDFFDYLIGTTAGRLLPAFVQSALVDNSLLFLGFRLTDWTFRVLFRLMMNLPGRERLKDYCHVAVQLDPELDTMEDVAGAKAYLAQYFGQESNIDIFWGSGPEFLTALRSELARDDTPAPAPAADEDDGWDF